MLENNSRPIGNERLQKPVPFGRNAAAGNRLRIRQTGTCYKPVCVSARTNPDPVCHKLRGAVQWEGSLIALNLLGTSGGIM